MADAIELAVPAFSAFSLMVSEGGVIARATVKRKGRLFFLTTLIKKGDDGLPRVGLFSDRIETFCGKPVRGDVHLSLCDAMVVAHEAALNWVLAHPESLEIKPA